MLWKANRVRGIGIDIFNFQTLVVHGVNSDKGSWCELRLILKNVGRTDYNKITKHNMCIINIIVVIRNYLQWRGQ